MILTVKGLVVPVSEPEVGESCSQELLVESPVAVQVMGKAQLPVSPMVTVCAPGLLASKLRLGGETES